MESNSSQWNGFAVSVPGKGHIRFGIPCQDASAVFTSQRAAVIVCDGRGSAKLSHYGARGAVEAFRLQNAILEPFLQTILDRPQPNPEQWSKFCRIMYRTLVQVKLDLGSKYALPEKEFDFTVAFALAGTHHIGFFQVGDGALVVRSRGALSTVFPPEKGEFANQTRFLHPGGEEQMDFQQCLLPVAEDSAVAATSDGPEHLMFQLADMTPGKIFEQMFSDLTQGELALQDLRDYLTRRAWDEDPRGADDRSLALLALSSAVSTPKDTVQQPEISTEDMPSAPTEQADTPVPEVSPKKEIRFGCAERLAILLGVALLLNLFVNGFCFRNLSQEKAQLRDKLQELHQQCDELTEICRNLQKKANFSGNSPEKEDIKTL